MLVVHTYDLSYLGGRDQEDRGLRTVQVKKKKQDPISKTLTAEKWQSGSSGTVPA
jgi:hypothetical protein